MAVRTFEAPLLSGDLRLDADERWAEEAQGLLEHLATLPPEQLNGLTVDTGWAELRVVPSRRATPSSGTVGGDAGSSGTVRSDARSSGNDFRVMGPSLEEGGRETEDLSLHLAAMVGQARTVALLGATAAPIRFDADITVERDALDADEIYIKRMATSADGNGWHLGPLTAEASEHIHLERRPAYEIVRLFPALLDFLALPDNYLVGLVNGEIDAVFNGEGKRVMGPGGVLRLEAHPALLAGAARELGITEPEALARSLYRAEHGYFLVWRDEPPAIIGVHPSGEQLRLQGLVGPDEFAELWERGDRTPVGYSLN